MNFNPKTKMAALVEADFNLLEMLPRLGITGPFGEKTLEEICIQNGLDPETVAMLCRVYSTPDWKPDAGVLRRAHAGDVLRYLHRSHDHYLNEALVEISSLIEELIKPCGKARQDIIWQFFNGYRDELVKHFGFEEEKVIPYIQDLLIGQRSDDFNIECFEQNHSNIDEKLSDLRNLVIKALPAACDPKTGNELLLRLFRLQEDLLHHTCIEDEVMVPVVKLMENPASLPATAGPETEDGEESEELSAREKEILVEVAGGLLNKEVADKLNISVNTVITHRKNITRKTGIKTVAGLTVYAILNNLIEIS